MHFIDLPCKPSCPKARIEQKDFLENQLPQEKYSFNIQTSYTEGIDQYAVFEKTLLIKSKTNHRTSQWNYFLLLCLQ